MLNYENDIPGFVESNLIAYIGNKRRLIDLIYKAIQKCGYNPESDKYTFFDVFAGTGVVSRLAKALGFKVVCNDWENYSYIINKLYIETDKIDIDKLFSGSLDDTIKLLNNQNEPKEEYIAKYYCPKNDNKPDVENERMFYTRENGKIIDAIREKIDDLYPDDSLNKDRKKEKNILIALLLYEAATRANTSGVFKGFHRGFGGSNGDALTRILKKIELSFPELINSKHKNRVYKKDALLLSRKMKKVKFDIAYLDPPYNQHQYGSNYHILNTVSLNDKPKVNETIYINGKKTDKSAIRKDWVKTRSPYCYKNEAVKEFKNLINTINAKKILISYSIDGIIPFEDMLEILSEKGKLDIVCSEYIKYRGGKQSLENKVRNVEFVLIVDTETASGKTDIIKVMEKLLEEKVDSVLKKTFCLEKAEELGWDVENGKFFSRIKKDFGGIEADICLKHGYIYEKAEFRYKNNVSVINIIDNLPFKIKNDFFEDIDKITNISKDIEINIFLNRMKELSNMKKVNDVVSVFKKIVHLLKKFNNRKAYFSALKIIIRIIDTIHHIGVDSLLKDKSFVISLSKYLKLIDDKLSVKRIDKLRTDEINFLKTRIRKKLIPVLGAEINLQGVSNL